MRVLNASDDSYKECPNDTISNTSDFITEDDCEDFYQNELLD